MPRASVSNAMTVKPGERESERALRPEDGRSRAHLLGAVMPARGLDHELEAPPEPVALAISEPQPLFTVIDRARVRDRAPRKA